MNHGVLCGSRRGKIMGAVCIMRNQKARAFNDNLHSLAMFSVARCRRLFEKVAQKETTEVANNSPRMCRFIAGVTQCLVSG